MPRTLPWLNTGVAKMDTSGISSPAPKRRKRSPSPSSDLVDSDLNDIAAPPPRPKQRKRADRTPSTSPVRPASSQLAVEYMRPGFSADDIYLMVEDEFVSTAKAYTAHIHQAEYARLKTLHRSRGEKILAALGHGTDGRTVEPRGVGMRREREEADRRRESVLGKDEEGSEEEEDDPYMQDPQLAGLMMAAGRGGGVGAGRVLKGMVKAKSNTRAAAGFSQSPHAAGGRYLDALKDDRKGGREAEGRKKASNKAPRVFEEFSDEEDDGEDDLSATAAATRLVPRAPEPRPKANDNGTESYGTSRTLRKATRDDNVFKRFSATPKKRSSSPQKPLRSSSSSTLKADSDSGSDDFRRRRPRPTYKKAQNRQAASQALATSHSAHQHKSSPLQRTGSENRMFKRPSLPASSREERKKSATPSPTKTHVSQGTSDARAAAANFAAKRAADRARKEKEQRGRPKGVDDIPTFLF